MEIGKTYSRTEAQDELDVGHPPQRAVLCRNGTIALFLHQHHAQYTNSIAGGVLWMEVRPGASENERLQDPESEIHLLYRETGTQDGYTYLGKVDFMDATTASNFRFRILSHPPDGAAT